MHTTSNTINPASWQDKPVLVSYRAICAAGNAEALATAIAWEQTVEVVPEAVHHQRVLDEFVGQVLSVEHQSGIASIQISYNPALVCGRVSALFNLIYGNVSMYPDVRVTDMEIPIELAEQIGGPQFGVEGIAALTHTHDQALLATALKPRGAPHQALADIAGQFATAGGHIIKDDQNLIEENLSAFADRIGRCQQAIVEANHRSGNHCLYFPHISGSYTEMIQQLDICSSLGIKAVLTCPLVAGLDTVKALCNQYQMAHMGHPAMSGAFTHARNHGIDAAVLLGSIYRLAGIDISIFPGSGGRLSLPADQSTKIQQRLQQASAGLKPSLPCPAGGKSLESLPGLLNQFGKAAVYLVGGALLAQSDGIGIATGRYLDLIDSSH